jgi:hypothetical protein
VDDEMEVEWAGHGHAVPLHMSHSCGPFITIDGEDLSYLTELLLASARAAVRDCPCLGLIKVEYL